MKYVKLVIAAFSGLGIVLGFSAGLQHLGGQGLFTLIMVAVPLILVGAAIALGRPFGRMLGALALVAFLIVGMKTSDTKPLQNALPISRRRTPRRSRPLPPRVPPAALRRRRRCTNTT